MPLTLPLAALFGPGLPGWLSRDVPGGTSFDFQRGRVTGPAGTFVRSPSSKCWARVN